MKSIWKKLKALYERLLTLNETILETELRRVKRSRARHKKLLDDIGGAWSEAGAPCCPNCYSAGEYGRLAGKVQRLDQHIEELTLKVEKHNP